MSLSVPPRASHPFALGLHAVDMNCPLVTQPVTRLTATGPVLVFETPISLKNSPIAQEQ